MISLSKVVIPRKTLFLLCLSAIAIAIIIAVLITRQNEFFSEQEYDVNGEWTYHGIANATVRGDSVRLTMHDQTYEATLTKTGTNTYIIRSLQDGEDIQIQATVTSKDYIQLDNGIGIQRKT